MLVALFIALSVADAVLTALILSSGGRELNPIVRFFIEGLGIIMGLAIIKSATVAMVIFAAGRTGPGLLVAGSVVYAFVVLHNARELCRVRS